MSYTIWIVCIIIIIIIGLLFFYSTNASTDKTNIIKTLVRQAARWSIAAKQDTSVMIAVLHANYGAGYLWALQDIATDSEITQATDIDVLKFKNDITSIQDEATRRMAELCPKFIPNDPYLVGIAEGS